MTEEPLNLPDIELDDEQEFKRLLENAQMGQYENTLLEMWDETLKLAINQITGKVTIPIANGLLRQWPWLQMKDLPKYIDARRKQLTEAREVLLACYPKKIEELYKENVDDWLLHKTIYRDVIVEWTKLSNFWSDEWEELPLNDSRKGVLLAAITDTVSLLVNPNSGLAENVRNLANYEVTEEESEEMRKLIFGETDE